MFDRNLAAAFRADTDRVQPLENHPDVVSMVVVIVLAVIEVLLVKSYLSKKKATKTC